MSSWSATITVALITHLGTSLLRVEHLIASDVWILLKGQAFRRRLDTMLKGKATSRKLNDPAERWRLYAQFSGGRLPWLFFGIQSGRLMMWSSNATGIGRIALKAVRGLWRYYTYAAVSFLLAVAYVWLCTSKSRLDSWLLLVDLSTLVIGSVAIAAGGVLASMRMGAFARYHHFKWPPKKSNIKLHELSLVLGSSLVAFILMTALIIVAGAEFGGFGSFDSADGPWKQFWNGAFAALSGIIGQGYSNPRNGFGVFSLILVVMVQISYVFILLGVTQKTWGGGR